MNQPCLVPVPWRNLWCVNEDFEVQVRGHKIVVPEFFLIDGASVPMALWPVCYHPFDTRVIAAALVHDWLYWSHQVDKYEADLIFLDLLLQNGADKMKAYAMYQAVAIFGENYWPLSADDVQLLRLLYISVKDSLRFHEYHFPVEALA